MRETFFISSNFSTSSYLIKNVLSLKKKLDFNIFIIGLYGSIFFCFFILIILFFNIFFYLPFLYLIFFSSDLVQKYNSSDFMQYYSF